MDFMDFPTPEEPSRLLDHAAILAACAGSLLVFHLADDPITGKAKVTDALGFTLAFLVAGYFIGWLPRIWAKSKATRFEPMVMPSFVAIILAYLYLAFRSYFVQPGATSIAVTTQMILMIYLSLRG